MNYFLILIILALCGGAYYQHTQDQQQVADLQQQVADLTAKAGPAKSGTDNAGNAAPTTTPASAAKPLPIAILPASPSRSTAIDSAAAAATAATTASSLGTITTLDGRTFQDVKVLKVEEDGITFNHADGITKILFPLLPPDLQKKYGYAPEKAVAQTAAQINYRQALQQNSPGSSSPGGSPSAANPPVGTPVTTQNP